MCDSWHNPRQWSGLNIHMHTSGQVGLKVSWMLTTVLSKFTTRKSMKAFSTTVSFFTANCCTWFHHFLVWYTFLCNLCRKLLSGALLLDTLPRGGLETGCDPCHPIVSQLIALEKHGRTQWLAEAFQEDDNTQKSPLTGSLREKEW